MRLRREFVIPDKRKNRLQVLSSGGAHSQAVWWF